MRFIPKLSTLKKLVDRKWKLVVIAILWVVIGTPWSYYDWPIPETKYGIVLGTRDKKLSDGTEQRRVHIMLIDRNCQIDEDADPYVLANETDWWFLKKDSENLHGKMRLWSLDVKGSVDKAPFIKFGHTGWRIKWIDLYPNLIYAKRLSECPYNVDEPVPAAIVEEVPVKDATD